MKVGQLMECDFGEYTHDAHGKGSIDGRIAPEMVKKRLAVVLNAKLNHGVVVVPVSSSEDKNKVQRGLHVHIAPEHVTQTHFFDGRDRWALCDHVQQVTKTRLSTVRGPSGYITDILPRDLVEKIQMGIITAINAASLLPKPAAAPVPQPAPELVAIDVGTEAGNAIDKVA